MKSDDHLLKKKHWRQTHFVCFQTQLVVHKYLSYKHLYALMKMFIRLEEYYTKARFLISQLINFHSHQHFDHYRWPSSGAVPSGLLIVNCIFTDSEDTVPNEGHRWWSHGLYTHVIGTHIICCHRCSSTLASPVPSVTSTLGKLSMPPSTPSTTCPPPRSSAPWELCSRRRMTRRHISGSTRQTPGADQFKKSLI